MTDVLVVGAGPAGSLAAIVLARAGVHVRLIDRASFPRAKLCGDTLNPGALSVLDRLGIGAGVRAKGRRITGMLVTGPRGASVAADYPDGWYGIAIQREALDLALVDAAVDAGVDFVPQTLAQGSLVDAGGRVTGVRTKTPSGACDMRARLVIAADGRGSRLAFGSKLARFARSPRRWAFSAYFSDVDAITSRGEMHVRDTGYTGVAALPGDAVNVCVVRDLDGMTGSTGPSIVTQALGAEEGLRTRFARARQVSPVTVLGPLAVDARAAGAPGLLLAGDAAGFIDPITGDGLRFALRGGELAALAALLELRTGEPSHEHLSHSRRREFRGKWRLNRAVRVLVDSPRTLCAAAAVGACWPMAVRKLVEIAGDVGVALRAAEDHPRA